MACNTISTFALNCTPTIGGVQLVKMKEHGSDSASVVVEIIPDNATFNNVMTYDKTKNVKYWTTDLSISIGEYSKTVSGVQGSKEFVETLSTYVGIDVEVTLFNGKVITIENMFVQTATWNDGPTKADAAIGTIVLQAVNKIAPAIS